MTEEKKEKVETFRKWGVMIGAIIAAVMSGGNFIQKNSEPDNTIIERKIDSLITLIAVGNKTYELNQVANDKEHFSIRGALSEYKADQREVDAAQWRVIRSKQSKP